MQMKTRNLHTKGTRKKAFNSRSYSGLQSSIEHPIQDWPLILISLLIRNLCLLFILLKDGTSCLQEGWSLFILHIDFRVNFITSTLKCCINHRIVQNKSQSNPLNTEEGRKKAKLWCIASKLLNSPQVTVTGANSCQVLNRNIWRTV